MAAKCWIAVNPATKCQITELKFLISECENHVQVVDVTMPGGEAVVIANIYDREGDRHACPFRRARSRYLYEVSILELVCVALNKE